MILRILILDLEFSCNKKFSSTWLSEKPDKLNLKAKPRTWRMFDESFQRAEPCKNKNLGRLDWSCYTTGIFLNGLIKQVGLLSHLNEKGAI